MATPKPNQEKIDAIIRQNKIERSLKHTTRTSFKAGQKVPGCGRKKGSKNDVRKITMKHYKKLLEEMMAAIAVSITPDDLIKLTVKERLQVMYNFNKFFMPELKAVETQEKQITKIEVSFNTEFEDKNIIDITPLQQKEEEDMNGENA